MTSPDAHTLTGAYALDALEEFERRQFEAHLAECPDCAREVAELRATAARLGTAVVEQPSDDLRRRVLGQIATTRQEAPITARPAAPRSPRGWVTRMTAAVAAVAVAAAVALGVLVIRTQDQLSQAQAQYGPIATVLAARDARVATTTLPGVGSATILASHSLDRAVLLVSGMPAPPAEHTYQAWLIGNTGLPRPAGLLTVTGTAVAPPPLLLVGGLDKATVLKITVEPAGGSAQPTTSPIMSVSLPA
jgi:anti-sigma-K factor RskA